jgi:hypothetical protein
MKYWPLDGHLASISLKLIAQEKLFSNLFLNKIFEISHNVQIGTEH